MAPGNRPDPHFSRDQLATEALGLAAGATPEDVRAAFLAHLRETRFFPGAEAHEAFLLLSGRPVARSRLEELADRLEEEHLQGELEAFAAGFFTLGVADRHMRWRDLSAACAGHDRPLARLGELSGGLGIDPETVRDPSLAVERLARHAFELFTLTHEARAIRKQEILNEFCLGTKSELASWVRAAGQLRRVHPKVAALAPDLMDDLNVRHWGRVHRKPLFAKVTGVEEAQSKSSPPSVIWVILVLIGGLSFFRNQTQNSGITSRPPFFPQPQPSPPSMMAPIRDAVESSLKRELAKLGHPLDGPRLHKLIDAIPMGDMLFSVFGTKTESQVFEIFRRDTLGRALAKNGIKLDEAQLDVLVKTCFPKPMAILAPAQDHDQTPIVPAPAQDPDNRTTPFAGPRKE